MNEYHQITKHWTDEEKKEYYPYQYYQNQKENYEQEINSLKHKDYINTYGEFNQVD